MSALDSMLSTVAASPDLMTPTAAQAMLDVLLTSSLDSKSTVSASVATKLSRAIVENSIVTNAGLEATLESLASMYASLKCMLIRTQ